jgi:hypothetical protein
MALVSFPEPYSTSACVDAVCPVHGVHVVRSIGRHSDVVRCSKCALERERDPASACKTTTACLADAMRAEQNNSDSPLEPFTARAMPQGA